MSLHGVILSPKGVCFFPVKKRIKPRARAVAAPARPQPAPRPRFKTATVSKRTRNKVSAPVDTAVSRDAAPHRFPGLFNSIGSGLGSIFGPMGSMVGAKAGDFLASITGFGDYKVESNTLVTGNQVPTFRSGGMGVEIVHKEFIGNVDGSVLFASKSYAINPGLEETFPWLSSVARCFQTYRFLGLIFEYRPSSGNIAATSPALGIVAMATAYDPLAPAFNSKVQIESYEYSSATVPSNSVIHPVECKARSNVLDNMLIRSNAAPGDLRFYDMGTFQIGTEGMQSAYTLGELWVSYHVLLTKPYIAHNIFSPDVWHAWAAINTASATNRLGMSSLLSHTDLRYSVVSTNKIGFHKTGHFLCVYNAGDSTGTVTDQVQFNFDGPGINGMLIWNNFGSNESTAFTVTGSTGAALVHVTQESPDNVVRFTGCTGMTLANADVIIAETFVIPSTLAHIKKMLDARSSEADVDAESFDEVKTVKPGRPRLR